MQKAGRNDPCPCGSGKKLKKCCEQSRSKRFHAEVMQAHAAVSGSQGAGKISSLFFRSGVAPISSKLSETADVSLEMT